MSTPAHQAAAQQQPAGQAALRPATAQQSPASQSPAQQSPAPAPAAAPVPARRSSTPSRLRLARGLAAAAALLTGIVATGTFDTTGVNATPNVVAAQWVAAERTGVEVAEADLAAAEAVAQADGAADTSALLAHVREAAGQQARAGGDPDTADQVAREIAGAGLLGQQAVQQAAADPAAANATYAESSASARSAAATSDELAAEHATDLATGSRSALTAVVGALATLALAGILVWLALRTRRMINVPLLLATVITGWLTYVSLNPGALPVNYDQRVQETTRTATALQDVLQARQSMYAVALGLEAPLEQDVDAARASVDGLDDLPAVQESWAQASDSVDELAAAEGTPARLEVLAANEEAFDTTADALRERLDGDLAPAPGGVGTTATVTSGVALLLGVVAAVLAWAGISRRLRDYR